MTKIRVSKENSIVLGGRLFISLLKAILVSKSKVLEDLIDYHSSATLRGVKFVEYNGPYIRTK